ncbi:MAG: hypothetical protein ACRDS0_28190 [Pseudonocardiaceae bacterium]
MPSAVCLARKSGGVRYRDHLFIDARTGGVISTDSGRGGDVESASLSGGDPGP